MSLLRAHKSVFEIVRDALSANAQTSHIKVSVGARFQGEQNPEVIIQQSSFDINDLNTADYGSFEISVLCYSNTYTEAANIADIVFTAVQSNNLYTLTETEPIEGTDPQEYNISETVYHIKGLDLFLEHYDEDGYEANVLIRATEAQDTTTGVGGEPSTGGSPTPYYPQSDYRIQDLADTNVASLAEGHILKYDFSEGEWVNATLPLLVSNGLTQSSVNGYTVVSLADSVAFESASTSQDFTIGGNLNFAGANTKLIRPLNTGAAAGPLTIQSNGDLVIELDQNADELDKAFIVKNGADTEVFKVTESGDITVNNTYALPTSDGSANYFLKTDGNGQLYFATLNGTSGNTNASPPPAIDTIDELLDTQISNLSDNQILRYDTGSSKWVNEDLTLAQSIGDLTDVDTTTVAPTDGQALVWDNAASKWEPGSLTRSLSGLTDTDVSSVTNGQALIYNTATSKWEPGDGGYPETTDVSAWFPTGAFFDFDGIGNSESNPSGVSFKPDGTKMYIIGYNDVQIKEFTLSTAWDVTTASLNHAQSVGAGSNTPTDLYISPDGTRIFSTDSNTRRVYQSTLSTAWDLSTRTVDSVNYFNDNNRQFLGIYFKPDGTKMALCDNADTIRMYSLSTAWDVTTATEDNSYGIDDVNTNSQPNAIWISDDGDRAIVVDQLENIIEYSLPTAWSFATVNYVSHQGGFEPDSQFVGFYYEPDIDRAFVVGDYANRVFEYTTKARNESSATVNYGTTYAARLYTGPINTNMNRIDAGFVYAGGGLTTSTNDTVLQGRLHQSSTVSLAKGSSGYYLMDIGAYVFKSQNVKKVKIATSETGSTNANLSQTYVGARKGYGSGSVIELGTPGTNSVLDVEGTTHLRGPSTTIYGSTVVKNQADPLSLTAFATGTTIQNDTFTAASDTSISSHTSDSGHTYTAVYDDTNASTDLIVSGGNGYLTSTAITNGVGMQLFSSAQASGNYEIVWNIDWASGNNASWPIQFVVGAVDTLNYFVLTVDSNLSVNTDIYKVVNGSASNVYDDFLGALGDGSIAASTQDIDVIFRNIDGKSTIIVNDVLVFYGEIPDFPYNTNHSSGFGMGAYILRVNDGLRDFKINSFSQKAFAASDLITNSYIEQGNFGVGTTTPSEKMEVNGNVKINGSLEATGSDGIILTSPGGTRYKVTVDNSGNLTTTLA